MSDQPVIIHFSRILTEQGRYIQNINLNKIVNELEAEKIIPPRIAEGLRGVNDEYEKSNIVISILHGRDEEVFKTFLKITAKEKKGSKFYDATKIFFSGFTMFPGYEQYATWPDSEPETIQIIQYNFVQIGGDIDFTVGRDGETHHDSVHGITLHIPSDSLPSNVKEIRVTIKVGFSYHKLAADMTVCSATVTIKCSPHVLFTKDVFLEVPHSASSADTSDLCFVKFSDDIRETSTVYGEVYNGTFPVDYPYGVITTRSFSSYVIVRGKRYLYHPFLKKTRMQWSKRKWMYTISKINKIVSHIGSYSDGHLGKPSSSSYWLCVSKMSTSSETEKFLCVVSQCTPTGFRALKQCYSGHKWEYYMSFSFDSELLVFHPQSAQDCGWSANTEGYYEIKKHEAERLCDSSGKLSIPVVQYVLTPDHRHEMYVPRITVNATGTDRRLSFDLTLKSPGTKSTFKYKLLQSLSGHPVEEDKFLQQLAYQLPVWQPVVQLLGLTASDIEHIEHDVSPSQGERAYKAFLQWMQKEGRCGATYDVLLQALCQATDVSDCKSITNAWWYAHQYLSNLAEQL